MSAFTDFIQIELPLRPYLANDVAANSVIVRQGTGPRQLSGIELTEGQIIMNIEGTLQAVLLEDVAGSTDAYVHLQEAASSTWEIEHNTNTELFVINVFEADGTVIVPDSITVIDADNVTVSFGTYPASGKAVLVVIRE
jgi:hypothetical protein